MSRDHLVRPLVLVVTIALAGAAGLAAETGQTPDESTVRAQTAVQQFTKTLEGARSLSVRVETEYDAVQESGLQVEFGARRRLLLRRPDRLYAEAVRRDGTRSELFFDGKTGVLSHAGQGVYSRAEMGPTVDAALDTLEDDLGVPLPGSGLLRSNLSEVLAEPLESASWLGIDDLDGTSCDHVGFSSETVDVQLWVTREEPPLLRRMVLTYVNDEGAPQFRADFRDWQLDVDAPDSLFVFTPVDGMEQVPFVSIGKASPSETRIR